MLPWHPAAPTPEPQPVPSSHTPPSSGDRTHPQASKLPVIPLLPLLPVIPPSPVIPLLPILPASSPSPVGFPIPRRGLDPSPQGCCERCPGLTLGTHSRALQEATHLGTSLGTQGHYTEPCRVVTWLGTSWGDTGMQHRSMGKQDTWGQSWGGQAAVLC